MTHAMIFTTTSKASFKSKQLAPSGAQPHKPMTDQSFLNLVELIGYEKAVELCK